MRTKHLLLREGYGNEVDVEVSTTAFLKLRKTWLKELAFSCLLPKAQSSADRLPHE